MGPWIARLRIRSLKAQVEAARLYSTALAGQFEAAPTGAEKTKIADRYEDALKRAHMLQFLLELLERKQRKAQVETEP